MIRYKKQNHTQTDLSNLFNQKQSQKNLSVECVAKEYNTNVKIINEIVSNNVLFKKDHYSVIKAFLNMDDTDLFGESTLDFMDKVTILFDEWIHQKKLYEQTNEHTGSCSS